MLGEGESGEREIYGLGQKLAARSEFDGHSALPLTPTSSCSMGVRAAVFVCITSFLLGMPVVKYSHKDLGANSSYRCTVHTLDCGLSDAMEVARH